MYIQEKKEKIMKLYISALHLIFSVALKIYLNKLYIQH